MALRMASPWKHPKTGMYWLRVRVPKDLVPLVGKALVQRSLATKDVKEAKQNFVKAMARLQREWSDLKPGVVSRLSPFAIRGLAGEFYRWFVDRHVEAAGPADDWEGKAQYDRRIIKPAGKRPGGAVGLYLPEVKKFLDERGILVDEADHYDLALAASSAGVKAKVTLARNAGGDYSDDPEAAKFPRWDRVERKVQMVSRRLTIADHFEDFAKEHGLEPTSRKKYRTCLQDLSRSLGSNNLNDATREKLLVWKQELIDRNLAPRSIREGHFTAARSFFKWAVANDKARINPMLDIEIRVPKKERTRHPYFTCKEADRILAEALRTADDRASEEFASARRWVPWILAYTGARVNEITALEGRDVSLKKLQTGESVWVIHIRRAKTKEPRWVPLHEHLVEQGFQDFVRARGPGPLFYDPERRRGGTNENPQYRKVGEKLAEWVRKIGVDDPGVSPNHGWRHRFKFVAKRKLMNPEIRDGICGHAPRTEGEAYGGAIDYDMMWPEIVKFPRYDFKPATERLASTPARRKASQDRAATRARSKARGRPTKASTEKFDVETIE